VQARVLQPSGVSERYVQPTHSASFAQYIAACANNPRACHFDLLPQVSGEELAAQLEIVARQPHRASKAH